MFLGMFIVYGFAWCLVHSVDIYIFIKEKTNRYNKFKKR